MENKTHFEHISGGDKQEKESAKETLQDLFESPNESLAEHELEKTPEEKETLKEVEKIVDEIILEYGGNPKKIPEENIYVLEPGSVTEIAEGDIEEAIHKPLSLKIGVERKKTQLVFAGMAAHEMFHLKAHKSARVGESGDDVRLYRSGISMVDKKDKTKKAGEEKEYFTDIEEAVVAECTKIFLEKFIQENDLKEEQEATARFVSWVIKYFQDKGLPKEKLEELEDEIISIPNAQEVVNNIFSLSENEKEREAYAAGLFQFLYERNEVRVIERYQERKKFNKLLDDLVNRSGGEPANREEAFSLFAQAHFSGNYLPLARVVERAFGKGSFRRIAEEYSTPAKE